MDARHMHPSARTNDPAPGAHASPAAAPAELADCCSAKPVVQVIMARQPADLLLCGHHYRASRHRLASASASVHALPGTPSDITAWIQLEHRDSPAAIR
jgi:hypothetical protein